MVEGEGNGGLTLFACGQAVEAFGEVVHFICLSRLGGWIRNWRAWRAEG